MLYWARVFLIAGYVYLTMFLLAVYIVYGPQYIAETFAARLADSTHF